MGNGKHSTVSSSPTPLSFQDQFRKQLNKDKQNGKLNSRALIPGHSSSADSHLGRLRSVDFRLGKVLLQSGVLSSAQNKADGLLLDNLWTPNTFLFSRTSPKKHCGFGFTCDIKFEGGQFEIRQMSKPRRSFIGLEDSALDIYDLSSPSFQRQVLGLMIKKGSTGGVKGLQESPSKRLKVNGLQTIVGLDVFSVQGLLGSISIELDWKNFDTFEILNMEGEQMFLAQRLNRISGGFEFQIFSEARVVVATLVRLEESKFILKLYIHCSPVRKALLLSFSTLINYLLSS